MTRLLVAAIAVALQLGCARHYDRGTLAAVSTKAVGMPMKIVQPQVEGELCWPYWHDQPYVLVVENALRKAPGANALVNTGYLLRGVCLLVRGTAVHVD